MKIHKFQKKHSGKNSKILARLWPRKNPTKNRIGVLKLVPKVIFNKYIFLVIFSLGTQNNWRNNTRVLESFEESTNTWGWKLSDACTFQDASQLIKRNIIGFQKEIFWTNKLSSIKRMWWLFRKQISQEINLKWPHCTMWDNACMSAKNSQLIISEKNQAAIRSKWHDGCCKLFLGVHIYLPQGA